MGNWTAVGGWGLTTSQFYSPANSFTESPTGNYTNGSVRTLTLTTGRNISNNPVTILTFFHKYTIEVLDNAYIEVSSDNGTTWNSVKYYYGTQSAWQQEVLDITELANSSTNLKIRFTLVTNGQVVADGWYVDNIKITNYMDVITGIGSEGEIPARFALMQNYPNPFNPSTKIRYSIAKNSFVTIKIYDALGKTVNTLVNENKNPGNYEISFDASELASGLYFYKIQAGDFTDVKKMILIK
jgi:hypothetical protein